MQLYVINPDPFLRDLISSDSLLTSLSSTTTTLSVYVELHDIGYNPYLENKLQSILEGFSADSCCLSRQWTAAEAKWLRLPSLLPPKCAAVKNEGRAKLTSGIKDGTPSQTKTTKVNEEVKLLHNACVLGGQAVWLMPYTERFWNLINMSFKRCHIIQWK